MAMSSIASNGGESVSSNESTRHTSKHPGQYSRTKVFRAAFVLSMLGAALCCGLVAYFVIKGLETKVGTETFSSIAKSAAEGARAITERKVQGGNIMSTVLAYTFPNASAWPLVALPGYSQIAAQIVKQSDSTSQGILMLLEADQIPQFEAHAAQVYRDQDYAETAGWKNDTNGNTFFGIYKKDVDGAIHRDTDGITSWGSPNDGMLVPILQHKNTGTRSLLYNVHSEEFRGVAIDSILACAEKAMENNTSPNCGVVTDFIELIRRPGPAALLYQPIFPVNDPFTPVGLVGTSMNWVEVLERVVPDNVKGLYCVISTDTATQTYVINGGNPEIVDHDFSPEDDTQMETIVLTDFKTGASASAVYTLTVYPSPEFYKGFRSASPLVVSLGFVAMIVLCSTVFFVYDAVIKREAHQRRMVLEMKRRFVRFISHEIRTPLNTVWMGLKLLDTELKDEVECMQQISRSVTDGNGGREAAGSAGSHHTAATAASQDDHASSTGVNSGDMVDAHTSQLFKNWLELTSDITENTECAIAVLNDLLNYDKVETGTLQIEIGEVSVWKLIKKTVGQFQIQAKNRQIGLSLAYRKNADGERLGLDPDKINRLIVVGDEMRLSQVLRNLISNALKFTERGGNVFLSATLLKDEPPDSSRPVPDQFTPVGILRIAVKDTGTGMSEEQLQQLFREGVQFDANRLQAGGGSGLGLFISKWIVQQHDGDIRAHSEGLGHGTTFEVDLPVVFSSTELENEMQEFAPSESGSTASDSEQRNHRILVVDDALLNRKMLVRLLEKGGHSCACASDGQEAVDMMVEDMKKVEQGDTEHIPFDTILMDYEMPVMKGPDAARLLRAYGCDAAIFGVTGNVLQEDVNYFKEQGADAVLSKPVNIQLLDELWEQHGRY